MQPGLQITRGGEDQRCVCGLDMTHQIADGAQQQRGAGGSQAVRQRSCERRRLGLLINQVAADDDLLATCVLTNDQCTFRSD